MSHNKKTSKELGCLIDNAAISVCTYLGKIYCKEVEFTSVSKLIQDASKASCSGATIWVEAEFDSLIIDGVKANKSMYKRYATV